MSRTFVPSLALVLTMLAFPLSGARPHSQILTIHDHPQKTHYLSDAEWPFVSAQGHWTDADGRLAHTHIEAWAPIWAEIPKNDLIVLRGRVQLFHVNGALRADGLFGNMLREAVWDVPGPVVGDPHGVVIRYFTATFDPTISYPDPNSGLPMYRPENGWFPATLSVYTEFADGVPTRTELWLPFYSKGDPNVPETSTNYELSARISPFGPVANGHGLAISEYKNVKVPILAPLTSPTIAPGTAYGYARSPEFDANFLSFDKWQVVLNPDIHNGDAGTLLKEVTIPGPIPDVEFNPATMPLGVNRLALVWKQSTGPGNATFPPQQELNSLLVVNVLNGPDAALLPPPPPAAPWVLSLDGTSVPPTALIVTIPRDYWMLGTGGAVLKNGVPFAGGVATALKFCGGTVYAFGTDGQWWRATDASWQAHGPADPCTGAPPSPVVDCVGSFGPWLEINPSLWRREFTVTQQPANGGKSCAVVANGG